MRVKRRSLRLQEVLTLYTCSWDSSKEALKALALIRTTMELMDRDMPSTTFSAKPYSLWGLGGGGEDQLTYITIETSLPLLTKEGEVHKGRMDDDRLSLDCHVNKAL